MMAAGAVEVTDEPDGCVLEPLNWAGHCRGDFRGGVVHSMTR